MRYFMAKAFRTVVLWLMIPLVTSVLLADPLNQWTWRFPNPQGYTLAAVTYGGGQFVAVGDKGTIITSPDGYHWVNRTTVVFPFLRGVAYADGEYAAVGDGGSIFTSSNAVTWTQIRSVTGTTLRGIAGNSGWTTNGLPHFLGVGDSGVAVVCTGATNWSAIPSSTSNDLYAVTWTPSLFYLVVGTAGTVTRFTTAGFIQR